MATRNLVAYNVQQIESMGNHIRARLFTEIRFEGSRSDAGGINHRTLDSMFDKFPGFFERLDQDEWEVRLSEIGKRAHITPSGIVSILESGEEVSERYRLDARDAEERRWRLCEWPVLYLSPKINTIFACETNEDRRRFMPTMVCPETGEPLLQIPSRPLVEIEQTRVVNANTLRAAS
jgi:hypothetical protein